MRRPNGIPLASLTELRPARRRSLLLRAAGVAILLGLVAWLALAVRGGDTATQKRKAKESTVVVLDVSGSIGTLASATIVRTLRTVGRQGGNAGLVLFSDDTEEALPPTAPAARLLDFVRVFRAKRLALSIENPWTNTLSAGTQIGKGLAAARAALADAGVTRGRVVLVSDLADAGSDVPRMRRELLTYARNPNLRLRVAVVPGYDPGMAHLFRRVLGRNAIAIGELPRSVSTLELTRGSRFPVLPAFLAIAAALALAAYEFVNAPLTWREAQT